MWNHDIVKKTFVDYFTNKGHTNIPSSSIIPQNDNSLLFVNSGMVQFKNIFLGIEQPKHSMVTNSQNCIRAGGKHNDLDDVGKDSYHHTYFEMLGNWSFNYPDGNSYFKKEAIDMAWDLLVNIYKLDKNNLYVTYFGGNNELGLCVDNETRDLWKDYLPENRILPFGMKENFWEMGLSGPCGPCTEIHYDKVGGRHVPELVNRDDPTLIEIWNLVFMQYNRNLDGSLIELSKKHVDTGMGAERLTAVLNNCTNYEIDAFVTLMDIIQKVTDGPTYTNKYGFESQNSFAPSSNKDDIHFIDMAYRVIADHVRTIIIAINDGVKPSPTERGYVLRRLIRRAVRYGTKLNAEDGFLSKIIKNVIDVMYPELINKDEIVKIVSNEEIQFDKIMKKGLKYFDKLKNGNVKMKDLFQLYTTYGFPIDIVRQMCEEDNIEFDDQEYDVLMANHVSKSKEGKKFKKID